MLPAREQQLTENIEQVLAEMFVENLLPKGKTRRELIQQILDNNGEVPREMGVPETFIQEVLETLRKKLEEEP